MSGHNSEVTKDSQPPSYEEVMSNSQAAPPPAFYPNPNIIEGVHVGAPSAPPANLMPSGTVPGYGSFETTPVTVVIQQGPVPDPANINIIGNCPVCRYGQLEDSISMLGLCCAIFFFPIGIICCLALREHRCNTCGTEF